MVIFLLLLVPSIDFQLLISYLSLAAEGSFSQIKGPYLLLPKGSRLFTSVSERGLGLCDGAKIILLTSTWSALFFLSRALNEASSQAS